MKIQVTKELTNKEEIYDTLVRYSNEKIEGLLPPLYHGSDLSTLALDEAQRRRLYDAFEDMISSLFALYTEHSVSECDKRLLDCKDDYGDSAYAYTFARYHIENNEQYQHGDFYVAPTPELAIGYSREARFLGEFGWIVHRMIEGTKVLGLPLPTDPRFCKNYPIYEERLQSKKQPILLLIANADVDTLRHETGLSLKEFFSYEKDRYEKEIRDLKTGNSATNAYRLDLDSCTSAPLFFMIKGEHYDVFRAAYGKLSDERREKKDQEARRRYREMYDSLHRPRK